VTALRPAIRYEPAEAVVALGGCQVRATVKGTPFDVSDHLAYCGPYEADAVALLEAAVGRKGAV